MKAFAFAFLAILPKCMLTLFKFGSAGIAMWSLWYMATHPEPSGQVMMLSADDYKFTAWAVLTSLGVHGLLPKSNPPRVPPAGQSPALAALAAIALSVALLSGCASYRETVEAFGNAAVADTQAVNDDYAKLVVVGSGAITTGALARIPSSPQKCALAELEGLSLTGCQLTAADVATATSTAINTAMALRFGDTASLAPANAQASISKADLDAFQHWLASRKTVPPAVPAPAPIPAISATPAVGQ